MTLIQLCINLIQWYRGALNREALDSALTFVSVTQSSTSIYRIQSIIKMQLLCAVGRVSELSQRGQLLCGDVRPGLLGKQAGTEKASEDAEEVLELT